MLALNENKMNIRLVCEIIAMILLHVIFYKVSIYYLLRYLDILNHSNKFNKNIFFITFLVCMSIFSLFLFELSNIVSNGTITYIWHIDICVLVCLLYIVIPVEFINTIFDSSNYKEILSPEFNSHSHIKLIKKYYIKISAIYKEQNGISKKIKKHFFLIRSIIFLSLLWLSLGKLKNMIYKKNYNYVIADDNTLDIRKYLLYSQNVELQKKNQNKFFNKTIFYLLERRKKCFNYYSTAFRRFHQYYHKGQNQGGQTEEEKISIFRKCMNRIYNLVGILCFMFLHYLMLLYKFIIGELLINICALGVTTNSIVAGISSMYFIYDYITTFVYYVHIPKLQMQIYNIEESILINFTNYMFKKEELERLQSNFDMNSKRFLYDAKKGGSPGGNILPVKNSSPLEVPEKNGAECYKEQQFPFNEELEQNSEQGIIARTRTAIMRKKKKTVKKASVLVNFTNRLKNMCTFKNSSFLNCVDSGGQVKTTDFAFLLDKQRHSKGTMKKQKRRLSTHHFEQPKSKKRSGNFSDHESTVINYFYKNINKDNVHPLKRSNSCPHSFVESRDTSSDDEPSANASEEGQMRKYASLNVMFDSELSSSKGGSPSRTGSGGDSGGDRGSDGSGNSGGDNGVCRHRDKQNIDEETNGEDTPSTHNVNNGGANKFFFKSISFPVNKFEKTKYNEKKKKMERIQFLYEMEKNFHLKNRISIDDSELKDEYSQQKDNQANNDHNMYDSCNEDMRKMQDIENYNKLKKEIENIVYTNTSMYYSLNAILSRKFEIQKNKNCLLGKINVFLNSVMFLTVIYKIIMSILNIIFIRIYIRDPFSKMIERICLFFNIKYNIAIIYGPYISLLYISYIVAINMKKFLQQIIQISTYFSFYFKLFSNMWILLISELMGLYFVTNSLLLTSYIPVNYNHIMNFVMGNNYDYNIFHLHSDYVFITSFTSTLIFCVLYMFYFYFF
ncbi:conserved Plasmodium protein, unknown function [Plasmodium knowlesi strain H]|uniref:Abscisic acid G-protein coupled receptor-like domain-containing protein n=3 Tax=Plasmodium knowlesi TaxID=5850 RepID=A0A5K1UZH2_PLAKH|nr:protein GPR89, putative [Plasmodium knowlesi strain H]OTN65883.1 Uncharacterized protein PKNOH_S100035300 [Plasmodium knowlesi]CAA9987718.1 protein GPR89, putative [Plasmodium knowlesi strain H]SBO26941.1 conserved Plasmodium protein, unknown function [Plasmodium knowlesi strain H]SBO29604.1 conserved Plasmodium protein, unknown function [Plasmodium knowlesi strain H]VVS77192.1 protein GPR89, putative [Plasmodium knowlesi strain H]|eukprot:XP_002258716.1 hypothetical protein, conserved in Plasmodium species [Plasmodium knowlesi strain H]